MSADDTEMRDATSAEPAGNNAASQSVTAKQDGPTADAFDNPFERFSSQPIDDAEDGMPTGELTQPTHQLRLMYIFWCKEIQPSFLLACTKSLPGGHH